jgi:hypothetical protein
MHIEGARMTNVLQYWRRWSAERKLLSSTANGLLLHFGHSRVAIICVRDPARDCLHTRLHKPQLNTRDTARTAPSVRWPTTDSSVAARCDTTMTLCLFGDPSQDDGYAVT